MGAAPDARSRAPSADPLMAADADRRAVAVAVDAVELLRPKSDLARILVGFARADVLLATEQPPADGFDDDLGDLVDLDESDDEATGSDDRPADEVQARAAALGHPDLVVHRLGLRAPLGPPAEGDLLAAVSELVGFDPERGVYCVAPVPVLSRSGVADPQRLAVSRVAERVARVYGIPLLRYRCLELSVVAG